MAPTKSPPKTRPSTQTSSDLPNLSEAARHLFYPKTIATSSWPKIRRRLSDMGVAYDPWQEGAGRLILGRDARDRYAATVGGVTMSLPRQVGKTFTIGSLLVAMCLEYPGLRVVWTSHHLRTTTNTFRSMQGMVRRRKVWPHVAQNGIRVANGEQEIRFANGSIIMFGARERGFGVGIDAIDILVCDEAQRLTSRSIADMMPTTNQARHQHGALVFYIGTPPRPTDAGDEFAAKRRKALAGKLPNGIYIELSADPDADLDDPEQWRKANVSYPHRTPHESMLRLREHLTDDDDWRHEALGIWDEEGHGGPFSPGAWGRCATDGSRPRPEALGLALDIDRVWLSLGVSGSRTVGAVEDGRVRFDQDGSDLVRRAAKLARKHSIPIVIDKRGPAGTLIDDLEELGAEVVPAGLEDYVQACADFYDAVEAKELSHHDDTHLTAAVKAAGWRSVGDRRVWSRKAGDISMLEAATLALWGARSSYDPLENIW